MLMKDVRVGDRIEFGNNGGHWATVTEIIENGFKYDYDEPWCLHWAIGTAYGGEHCGFDGEVCDADYLRRANAKLKHGPREIEQATGEE